jgi:hypothetical protein
MHKQRCANVLKLQTRVARLYEQIRWGVKSAFQVLLVFCLSARRVCLPRRLAFSLSVGRLRRDPHNEHTYAKGAAENCSMPPL